MKKLLTILIIFCANTLLAQSNTSQPFTASAGVFRQSDTLLLRTLFSDSTITAIPTLTWDGKDDYGNTVTPAPAYFIRIRTNNVQYTWDGIIGNSSDYQTGSTVHKGYYTSITGMAITGAKASFCQGYSELYPSQAEFNLTTPQQRHDIFPIKSTSNMDFVATNGTYNFWSGYNAYKGSESFLMATKVSDGTQVSFGANGIVYTVPNLGFANTYTSLIDYMNVARSRPTGLAATPTYVYNAHGNLDYIHVLNMSGAVVQTLSYTNPRYLNIYNDTLWMATGTNTVGKYIIQPNGTLSSAALTITAVTIPGAICYMKNGTVAIIDQSTRQLRFFNTATGTEGTALGTSGGYASSPDVTNYKFFFNDFRGNTFSFVSVAPDSSFWLGDPGNFRELHFSKSKVWIETIMSLGTPYSVCVDLNNTSRVFANYLEFSVDGAALSGSTGWTLVKNWGYNYNVSTPSTTKLLNVVTLSNGKTYGHDYAPGQGLVELTATGLRPTGSTFHAGTMNTDGSLTAPAGSYNTGSHVLLYRYPLTGFASSNPVWGTPVLLSKTPTNTVLLPDAYPGNVSPFSYNFVTTSGKVFWYNPSILYAGVGPYYDGYHLGATNLYDSAWKILTARSLGRSYAGNFPNPQYFDIGNGVNQYAGNNMNVIDNNIFTGYNGEGWKQVQTNYYNHYYEDGLAIGQFGVNRKITGVSPAAGAAGNARTAIVVPDGTGNGYYMYHGDESIHAGAHRWHITGLNSISYQDFISGNVSPTANAGTDQTITLPTSSASLTGSASDADGTIVSYAWTKISGGAATITSPSSAPTTVTGLVQGVYLFQITATDNGGATASDIVQVTVNAATATTHTLGSGSGSIYFINGSPFTALPGDIICITSGTYTNISLDGLVGDSLNPIIIKNCGGLVQVANTDSTYGFRIVNSQFFHVTGTGQTGLFYGFKAGNGINWIGSGMNCKENTSDYEIDHYESYKAENGFLCKIDPYDDLPESYSTGWLIKNVNIHDCKVRLTKGEGAYLVNTASYVTVNISGVPTDVEPVKGQNIKFHDVIMDSTGWDGVQVAATIGTEVYNVALTNYGWKNAGGQQAGIFIGGKGNGSIHDCTIKNGTGNAIENFGFGPSSFYNILTVNTGIDGAGGQDAFFMDDRPLPSNQYINQTTSIINCTIVNSGRSAIKYQNSNGTMGPQNKVYNNLISLVNGVYIDPGSAPGIDEQNNITVSDTASAKFVSTTDFHLRYDSPARDASSINTVTYNVQTDLDGVTRAAPYDAGAYEFAGVSPIQQVIKNWLIIYGKIIFR